MSVAPSPLRVSCGRRAGRTVERVRTAATLLTTAVLALTGTATAPATAETPAGAVPPSSRAAAPESRVLAVSIDGLNPAALRRLGPERTPTLHRLLDEGAGTLNARTAREMTKTLPNHTSMVTGRRIDRRRGGHGVTWNVDLPDRTVQGAAREPVASVFTVVDDAGGTSALFAGKSKFSLFPRSWPQAVDRYEYLEDPRLLVRAARSELRTTERDLVFVHLALPDTVGHDAGFMSPRYLDAVARTNARLGKLVQAIDNDPGLRRDVTVVLTADHGGTGRDHYDASRRANFRVPFVVWGRTVPAGDLYELNPTRRDPGRNRTTYAAARQPVRNADLANVVTDLLDLPAVPGSEFGETHDLVVTRP